MSLLRSYLEKNTDLNSSNLEKVYCSFRNCSLERGEAFIKTGDLSYSVAFIEEGILKATMNSNNKSEKIHYFIPEGHFISEIYNLYHNQPAKHNILAATPVRIRILDNYHELLKKIKNLDLIMKTISEKELIYIIAQKEIQSIKSAPEKYQSFTKQYPKIADLVKDIDTASFLGLNKSSLSRLKNKLLRHH